jgi:phosphomannomutase
MLEEINKRSNSSLTKTQLILKEKKKYLIEIKESKDKLNVANERIKILETQIKELKNKDLINVQKIKELKKKLKKYKEENVANALKIQETEKKIKVMVNTQQKNQKTEEYFIKNDLIKKLKFFMESKVEVEVKKIDEEEPKELFKKFNLF